MRKEVGRRGFGLMIAWKASFLQSKLGEMSLWREVMICANESVSAFSRSNFETAVEDIDSELKCRRCRWSS